MYYEGKLRADRRNTKTSFLQTNYQFIVDQATFFDEQRPDQEARWKDIISMIFTTDEHYDCPICLDRPCVSKITACGHIFCYPCLLQLFKSFGVNDQGEILSAETFVKCPLCNEHISCKELKSIDIIHQQPRKVNEQCEFILMKRHINSMIVVPVTIWTEDAVTSFPTESLPHSIYNRFILSDEPRFENNHINYGSFFNLLQKEKSQLSSYYHTVTDAERVFVGLALEQLDFHIEKTVSRVKSSLLPAELQTINVTQSLSDFHSFNNGAEDESIWFQTDTPEQSDTGEVTFPLSALETPSSWEDLVEDDDICSPSTSDIVQDKNNDEDNKSADSHSTSLSANAEPFYPNNSRNNNDDNGKYRDYNSRKSENDHEYIYFYQEITGRKIFLQPSNFYRLVRTHGYVKNLPNQIIGTIAQMQEIKLDYSTRLTYPILAHIPKSSICNLCVIDISK